MPVWGQLENLKWLEREPKVTPAAADAPWRIGSEMYSTGATPNNHSKESLADSVDSSSSFSNSKLQLPPLSLNQSSLWPRSSELLHLLDNQDEPLAAKPFDEPALLEKMVFAPAVEESPLTGKEALLSRPDATVGVPQMIESKAGQRSLAALLGGYQSSSPLGSSISSAVSEVPAAKEKEKEMNASLQAEFISDVTVPDGQVFPPGAEFVKCWKMANTSRLDWPESTQLVFLAGESLSREKGSSTGHVVNIGAVKAGEEIEVSTDELKVRF
jgi:next-to-BRCA1 protein 1